MNNNHKEVKCNYCKINAYIMLARSIGRELLVIVHVNKSLGSISMCIYCTSDRVIDYELHLVLSELFYWHLPKLIFTTVM